MMGVCDYPNDSFLYFKYYVTVTGVTPEYYAIQDDGVDIWVVNCFQIVWCKYRLQSSYYVSSRV